LRLAESRSRTFGQYLETHVQSDWICLDVGANLGIHTLSLATLVLHGRVIAFEADPSNYVMLKRNVQALKGPKDPIEIVPIALWDTRGTLTIGGANELAGCSFVSPEQSDVGGIEHRLRAVVNPAAIERTDLHLRMAEISALPLDEWISNNPQPRVDLIKLDVEGAEINVIRGAVQTLHQYRPTLLIEYNPACATTYFGQPADALFRELKTHFDSINVLEENGALNLLAGWDELRLLLERGKGWEDLVCFIRSTGCP
jgi:FkbM family methyltransferase